jgi:5-methylthioadenosine/S-adenosylhomocysteine deaminase
LIADGNGPFAEMFKRRGIAWQTPGVSPTRYMSDHGIVTKRSLLIHCVHQSEDDIAIVETEGAAIIHCPKSNAKLGAGTAPLSKWLAHDNLRLGIGTDSAVSNNALDLFEEMRFALLLQRAKNETVLPVKAEQVLRLATSRGADAMGLCGSIGTLTPGKKADLIALRVDGLHMVPANNLINTLIYSARGSDVALTVIGGEICYDNGGFPQIETASLFAAAARLNEKITAVQR